jgi:RNA polymerase sigma-70 factor (ECF subfamily)
VEADAFERALRPLLRRSAAYAVSFLGDRRDAEDAVQQAALRAWDRRTQFDGQRPFKAWWFGVLRNHCLDQLRTRTRAPISVSCDDLDLSSPADEGALDRLALATAMEKLPVTQRDALQLRYFGDLTYQELAQVLEIPQGTVMSRLHLARKALAGLMRTEER